MNHPLVACRFCVFALSLLAALASELGAKAASPAAINYQGIARKADGTPIGNQLIKIRASVHQDAANGTVVFQESHSSTTTAGGQFAIRIGRGTPLVNTFASIDWPGFDNYLQIEIDPTGGNAFVDMGTQQFVSVPYALHANSTTAVQGSPFTVPMFNASGGRLTDSVISQSGGSIGINNLNPGYRLDVTGSAQVSNLLLTGGDINGGRDVNASRDVNATGDVTVSGGKGIVRSQNGTQLKIVRATASFSVVNLASNSFVDSGALDYENFGGVPTVVVGGCSVQNGEWYKVMIVPINITANQCQLRLFNFASDTVNFSNATWQVLVVGPQ